MFTVFIYMFCIVFLDAQQHDKTEKTKRIFAGRYEVSVADEWSEWTSVNSH